MCEADPLLAKPAAQLCGLSYKNILNITFRNQKSNSTDVPV